MDVAPVRDWVIIILGILEIIFVIGLIIALLVVYSKINHLIARGKETVKKIEKTFTSPYLKAGSWLFKSLAAGLGMLQRRSSKEE